MRIGAHIFAIAAAVLAGAKAYSQSTVWSADGSGPGEHAGAALAAAADMDGDGAADLAEGAPGDPGTPGSLGRVRLRSGRTGSVLWTRIAGTPQDAFGHAVAGLGDLNQDGIGEIAAGAPLGGGASILGFLRVLDGATGAPIRDHAGAAAVDLLGAAVASLGDLDGDGVSEYAAGAPQGVEGASVGAGYVAVYSGSTGARIRVHTGSSVGDLLGWTVACAGDLDLDGIPEIAAGAPGAGSGKVHIYRGSTGVWFRTLVGGTNGDFFGGALAAIGDADGDGLSELLVGADDDDAAGNESGSARLCSGSSGTVLFEILGTPGSELGRAVSAAGDFDSDGYADFALGAPAQPIAALAGGAFELRRGRDGGRALEMVTITPASMSGAALACVGDADGDGFPDLALGAPGEPASASGVLTLVRLLPIGLTPFGTELHGCAGPHILAGSGVPFLGNTTFALGAKAAPPSALGLLLVTDQAESSGSDLFGIGVPIYCGFSQATFAAGFDFPSDALGFAGTTLPVPSSASLAGAQFFAQAIFAWTPPCAPSLFGLSASGGLKIQIAP
ncbi:MAG: FG-GAP repeat protein [Planctomycetes bacterium]|nr:FG-GAP repeat protein [Planctomycetota bacterium]